MSRWSGSLETSSRTVGVGLPNNWIGIQPRSSREQPQAGQPNTVITASTLLTVWSSNIAHCPRPEWVHNRWFLHQSHHVRSGLMQKKKKFTEGISTQV